MMEAVWKEDFTEGCPLSHTLFSLHLGDLAIVRENQLSLGMVIVDDKYLNSLFSQMTGPSSLKAKMSYT